MIGVIQIIAPQCWRAQLENVALERRLGRHLWKPIVWRNAMLSFDSDRDVLSELARGHQQVKCAWCVVLALAVFFGMLAW